jgi:hypothetical protein
MARPARWLVSLTRSALGVIVFGLGLCGPASAVLVTIDENGHGTFGAVPLAFDFAKDPGPGGQPLVLRYILPFPVVTGDVGLAEVSGVPSDLLRFIGGAETSSVFFYSTSLPVADSLADTANPPGAVSSNFLILPEGNNGTSYAPTSGQPGFATGVTYRFISDSTVAEPSPAALLLLGLGVMAFGLKRRGLGMS